MPLTDPLLANFAISEAWGSNLAALDAGVRELAEVFERNLKSTELTLQVLPIGAVEIAIERERRRAFLYFTAHGRKITVDQLTPAQVQAVEALLNSEGLKRELRHDTERQVSLFLDHVMYRESIRALLAAATTATWTAVECLAGDLWALVTDRYRPTTIAAKDLARYESEKGAPFSSVGGIQRGFELVCGQGVAKAFNCEPLRALEAARHVLVHAAGTIDARYLRDGPAC